jgi:hypothetical protein
MQVFISLVAFPVHFQAKVDDELWKEEDGHSLDLSIFRAGPGSGRAGFGSG